MISARISEVIVRRGCSVLLHMKTQIEKVKHVLALSWQMSDIGVYP